MGSSRGRTWVVCAGVMVGHFLAWSLGGRALTHLTGDAVWEYHLGGFALMSSPLVGMGYWFCLSLAGEQNELTRGAKLVGAVVSIPITYGLLGLTSVKVMDRGALPLLVIGGAGLVLMVDLYRRLWRVLGLTPAASRQKLREVFVGLRGANLRSPARMAAMGSLLVLAIGMAALALAMVTDLTGHWQQSAVLRRGCMGTMLLGLAAPCLVAVVHTILTGETLRLRGWSRGRLETVRRRQSPGRFWCLALLLALATAALLALSVLAYAGALDFSADAGP